MEKTFRWLQVHDGDIETWFATEPVGLKTLRVEITPDSEITRTWNDNRNQAKRPPGCGWHILKCESDHTVWRRIAIPLRTDQEMAAEAKTHWGGSYEKVATAAVRSVYVYGALVKSRYGKARELRRLSSVIEDLPSQLRSAITEACFDSKSGAISLEVNSLNEDAAQEISYHFGCGPPWWHSGITFIVAGEDPFHIPASFGGVS
jgi:hypothetical protein